MRVADKMAFNQVNANIARNRSEMADLQNQAATQKRVTKPSDDPVAASRVLFARTDLHSNQQFVKNLNFAKSFIETSEQSLSELSEILIRAKELALSQASDGSANSQSRKITAMEISQLRDQMVQIGNRKLGDRYLFGGFKTTDAPFDADGKYRGDAGEMRIHVDKDSFIVMNMPGNTIFSGDGISKDGSSRKSIKQAASVSELEEQKQKYPDKFPALSAGDSTIKDEPQTMTRGPASLRGPTVDDSEAIVRTPQDGVNLFSTFKRLETALIADDKAGVQESIERLDDALQQVVLSRSQLGSRVSVINNALNSMYGNEIDIKATISQHEDADVFKVVSDMNKNESTLQATLQTSGKMIQKSLMDFIS
jgi:flagellar hook-associated protein 3 FlgL